MRIDEEIIKDEIRMILDYLAKKLAFESLDINDEYFRDDMLLNGDNKEANKDMYSYFIKQFMDVRRQVVGGDEEDELQIEDDDSSNDGESGESGRSKKRSKKRSGRSGERKEEGEDVLMQMKSSAFYPVPESFLSSFNGSSVEKIKSIVDLVRKQRGTKLGFGSDVLVPRDVYEIFPKAKNFNPEILLESLAAEFDGEKIEQIAYIWKVVVVDAGKVEEWESVKITKKPNHVKKWLDRWCGYFLKKEKEDTRKYRKISSLGDDVLVGSVPFKLINFYVLLDSILRFFGFYSGVLSPDALKGMSKKVGESLSGLWNVIFEDDGENGREGNTSRDILWKIDDFHLKISSSLKLEDFKSNLRDIREKIYRYLDGAILDFLFLKFAKALDNWEEISEYVKGKLEMSDVSFASVISLYVDDRANDKWR